MARTETCSICGGKVAFWDQGRILRKYDIAYYRCEECGFIQSENPYWLSEAYASAINRSDVGYVSRNFGFGRAVRLLLDRCFDAKGQFLDYGAGYGMFVRHMRDMGYEFYGYDAHCVSLFAPDFLREARSPERYELVTAFEVFEHLVDPVADLRRIFDLTDSLLFSTFLLPRQTPKTNEWWYYGLDHGQHVSFYSATTVKKIGEMLGCNAYHLNDSLHLLTRRNLHPQLLRLLGKRKLQGLYALFPQRRSLLPKDHAFVLELLETQEAAKVSLSSHEL
ncbi:class I SAM-dependent methyltransferase [Spartobacteria bacterium LR76]|nr:class I SAM-dependent methyltransferase [Spartobacteria bacterium LR76]